MRLVVDASVATSAGEENERGEGCHEVLQEILRICHRVTMTEAIEEEWREHSHKFARAWLHSMYARRKVDWVVPKVDKSLESRIVWALPRKNDQDTARKDLHLIQAAIKTDRIVLSADKAARDCFREATAKVHQLRRIEWADPTTQSEPIVEQLKTDDKHRKRFSLGEDD